MRVYLISKDPNVKACISVACENGETLIQFLEVFNLNFWTTVGWFDYFVYKYFKRHLK